MIKIDLIESLKKQMNFCQENRRYKCGVYVTSKMKSEIVMKVISNLLPAQNRGIELRNSTNEAFIKFPNGNLIRIVHANSTARGNRFNGIIVDSTINKEILNTVILPCLMPIFREDNSYDIDDNPTDRMYFTDITDDDVVKSAKYRPILYVTSSRGNGKSMRAFKEMLNAVSCGYSIRTINYDEIIFEKEYESMFYENDYDRPVVDKELNGDRVMLYEAWGIPKALITYSTEFVNKTKKTYLNVTGKHEIPELGFENDLNIHLLIDTNIYDGYEVHIEDGLVTVVLHEIKNEAPVLKDYGVA